MTRSDSDAESDWKCKQGPKAAQLGPFARPPSLSPISEENMSILRKPKFILDGMSKDYIQHWTPKMAVDEHVQNWRDQMETIGKGRNITVRKSPRHDGTTFFTADTELLAVLVVRKSNAAARTVVVTLRNYSARIFPWYFQFGTSGKRDLQNCRGKFGDGLPSSTLVLTRYSAADPSEQKRKVVVASCGQEYSFGFEQGAVAQESSSFTIYNHWYDSSSYSRTIDDALTFDPFQDTEVTLHLQDGDFDPSRYLFLDEIPKDKLLTSSHGQVILDPKYQNTIYLQGMRAQNEGHFGYNFEKVSSRNRDRQNAIPRRELQNYVVDFWLTLINNSKAASALYDLLLTHPDSFESRAFNDTKRNTSDASDRLATVFRERNKDGFPLMEGDSKGKDIVEKHLKEEPVFVTRTLFQLLSAAEKLETSVSVAWGKLIEKFIAKARDIPKDALSQRLCDDVVSVIKPLVKEPISMLMVNDKSPGERICVVDGPKMKSFKLSGFQCSAQNGIYKEMSGEIVHGREAFRGGQIDAYCLVWNSNLLQWNLVDYTNFPTWSRQSTTGIYALCASHNFWNSQSDSQWCQWAECINGEFVPAEKVIVTPDEQAAKTGPATYRVFVSRKAVMKRCHDLTLRANCDTCETHEMFENTCFCAHDSLVDVISETLQQRYRVCVSKKMLKTQRARLHWIFFNSHREWKRLCDFASLVHICPLPSSLKPTDLSLPEWLSGLRDGSISFADDISNAEVKRIKDLLNNGLLRIGRPLQSDAYLGDAFLDLYVAWEGVRSNLPVSDMDHLRRTILHNAKGGSELRASFFNAKVGRQLQKCPIKSWREVTDPVSALLTPESTETLHIRVERRITEALPTSSRARQDQRKHCSKRNSLPRRRQN